MVKVAPLVDGEIYHIFNKSIAGFQIFNDQSQYGRMLDMIRYYQIKELHYSFSKFCELNPIDSFGFNYCFSTVVNDERRLVNLLAYCLMPTHFHFILKQMCENGISIFLSNLLNSYTRFFNSLHKRRGPLWVGRFGRRLIKTDEDFLQMSRYVHLNPATAGIVKKPESWKYSSYKEYLQLVKKADSLCNQADIIEIKPKSYKKFVDDQVGYQKELAKIKKIVIE